MLRPSQPLQALKTNNTYFGCPLILSKPEYEANKNSCLVCHYCKQGYMIKSCSIHFNKCLAQQEKRRLDPTQSKR